MNRLSIFARVGVTLGAALILGATVSCTEYHDVPTARAVKARPGQLGYTLLAAGTALACPPGQGFVPRAVSSGAEVDANGNGTVCDRRVGTPGAQKAFTLDDIVVPAGMPIPPVPPSPPTPPTR